MVKAVSGSEPSTESDAAAEPRDAAELVDPSEIDLRRVAIKRLKQKRDFRSHLFVYAVVNIALWAGWVVDGALNGWEFPWPVFPTVIWGLFVLGHANDVYWRDPLREDLVQQEIDKLRAASRIHPLDTYDIDDDDFC